MRHWEAKQLNNEIFEHKITESNNEKLEGQTTELIMKHW